MVKGTRIILYKMRKESSDINSEHVFKNIHRMQWIAFNFFKFRINKKMNKLSVEAHLTNTCHLPATLLGERDIRSVSKEYVVWQMKYSVSVE